MSLTPSYVTHVPYGMGMNIDPLVESKAARTFVWRLLAQPDYWTDGGIEMRGHPGYIATLPTAEWNQDASALAGQTSLSREFVLVGKETERYARPEDAAFFMDEWARHSRCPLGFPGITPSAYGLRWLDDYLDYGGRLPAAWHIRIRGEKEDWAFQYRHFLTWMRRRAALLPVVVTDVEAGTILSKPHRELASWLATDGFRDLAWLSAFIWSTAYDPQRWGATMMYHSMTPTVLGRLWVRLQRDFRDARASDRPGPAWRELVSRDRESDLRPPRRRTNRQSHTGTADQRHVRRTG